MKLFQKKILQCLGTSHFKPWLLLGQFQGTCSSNNSGPSSHGLFPLPSPPQLLCTLCTCFQTLFAAINKHNTSSLRHSGRHLLHILHFLFSEGRKQDLFMALKQRFQTTAGGLSTHLQKCSIGKASDFSDVSFLPFICSLKTFTCPLLH